MSLSSSILLLTVLSSSLILSNSSPDNLLSGNAKMALACYAVKLNLSLITLSTSSYVCLIILISSSILSTATR